MDKSKRKDTVRSDIAIRAMVLYAIASDILRC